MELGRDHDFLPVFLKSADSMSLAKKPWVDISSIRGGGPCDEAKVAITLDEEDAGTFG